MAYIWSMAVVVSTPDEFVASFPVDPITIGNKVVSFDVDKAGERAEVGIFPVCDDMDWIRCGGAREPGEVDECNAIAWVLYSRLHGVGPFLAAMTGTEVCEWIDCGWVHELLNDGDRIPGLILCDEWAAGADRSSLVPFRPGYVWTPYAGGRT